MFAGAGEGTDGRGDSGHPGSEAKGHLAALRRGQVAFQHIAVGFAQAFVNVYRGVAESVLTLAKSSNPYAPRCTESRRKVTLAVIGGTTWWS